MHRTIPVPRSKRPWLLLLLAYAAFASSNHAVAQEKFVLTVPIGTYKAVRMSMGQNIVDARSDNPKVARLFGDKIDQTVINIRGEGKGSTTVHLTDEKKMTESFEVRVLDPFEATQVQILVGDYREITMSKKQPITHYSTDDPNIAGLFKDAKNPTLLIVQGKNPGKTIVYASDAAKNIERFEIDVHGKPRVDVAVRHDVQQVALEVVVAVVNRSESRLMNFSFINNRSDWFLGSILSGPLALTNTLSPAVGGSASALAGSPNIVFGVLSGTNGFNAYLGALRTEGLAKVLAEPRVTTLSGKAAYIVSGGETPILTSSGQGAPSVQYKQFGTVVNFVPIVLPNGKIYLEVRPELSFINAANGISIGGTTPTVIPGFDTRSAQVAVQMEDGQTLAIGGLIQNIVNNSVDKVPILGDMPILGAAFRKVSAKETEEELIILVTPRLVDPIACTQIPRFLPGRETRNADDFELFLEGILEAPRGQRDVCLGYGGYVAAHRNGPLADSMPCGDNSHGHFGGRGCGPVRRGLLGGGCSSGHCGSSSMIPASPGTMPATVPATPSRPSTHRVISMPEGGPIVVETVIDSEPDMLIPARGEPLPPVSDAPARSIPAVPGGLLEDPR